MVPRGGCPGILLSLPLEVIALNVTSKSLFIFRMRKACEIARMKGAVFNEPVVFAQAALESAWGTSRLAREACNLFGIKATPSWKGPVITLPTREYVAGRWIVVPANWRKYPSWNECIVDYSRILHVCPWYRDALENINDPDAFLKGLLPTVREPGWATDPIYEFKVKQIAKEIEKLGGPKWEKS